MILIFFKKTSFALSYRVLGIVFSLIQLSLTLGKLKISEDIVFKHLKKHTKK